MYKTPKQEKDKIAVTDAAAIISGSSSVDEVDVGMEEISVVVVVVVILSTFLHFFFMLQMELGL